jgi:nicotinamidase-related amidase
MQQKAALNSDCYGENYSSENTAILIVDPFNDFLSEGGKLWSRTKETVKGVNLIENLKNILSAARSSGIKVVYLPHHLTEKGTLQTGNSWLPHIRGL